MNNETPAQPFPFSAIPSCSDKQPIACIEGTLTSLFPRKSGENSQGEWSIQNGEISAEGMTISLFIKDRDELPSGLKNERIRIFARTGQSGLSGIYVMDDSHNGKTTRKIKVTPTAMIEQVTVSGLSSQQPNHQQQQQQQQPPAEEQGWPDENTLQPQQQPQQQQPPNQHQPQNPLPQQSQKPTVDPGIMKAKKVMMQLANAQVLAAKAVTAYVGPEIKKLTGTGLSEEKLGNMITSLTLESWRKGLHCELPTRPLRADEI